MKKMTKNEALQFLDGLEESLRVAKARWVDPECIDDGEEIMIEYPDFIEENTGKLAEAITALKEEV